MPIINRASPLTDDKDNDIKKSKSSVRRRSKGEKTREKILLATIDVLSENGIKGTTHRAIAAQAELQLSLTTYYFKDIQELVEQAFTLNCQNTSTSSHHLLAPAFSLIETIERKDLRKVAVKEALCDEITDLIALQLINRVVNQSQQLLVEQFMFSEVQVSANLSTLAEKHLSALMLPFEQLCQYFNKADPYIDAQILYSYISQLQYSQVTHKDSLILESIRQPIRKIIAWIMKVK
jgi:DNA-binding transcriptional regulator YbjK